MVYEAEFICAFCGELNTTTVDATEDAHQQYVEDCQVCCRPNLLDIRLSENRESVTVDALMD